MNRFLPIAALCVALLALGAALMPGDPVVSPPPGSDSPRPDDDAADLRRRIEQLEDDHRALWDRLVMLERRPQGAVLVTDAGVVAKALLTEVAQLREEVRSVMVGEVLSNEAGRKALKEVLREVEADQRRERQALLQQRQQQRAAEQKARRKEFVTSAKLTFAQEQELTRRLEAEDAARRAMVEAMESAGGQLARDEVRKVSELRRETDKAMSATLDDSQQQAYQTMRREERGGGGRGGRQ